MRSHIKKYLSLTKKEWNGMVVLVIIMMLILAFPYAYDQLFHKDNTINTKDFAKAEALLSNAITYNELREASPDLPAKAVATVKLQPGATIELNTADSAKLTQVHGIGPVFAMSIIRYRGRLGGFYSKEQLKEIYDIDLAKYDEIKDQLTINPAAVSRIKINTISFVSLRQFPYLTYKQANALIQYRAEHGNYHNIEDIENIPILSPQDIHKIKPYITYK
ncbi:MAG: helix-hairpin-helix domain-containing protein [Mucilaginibacter sp.]